VTSGGAYSVACCRYCGREFDVRRFQVRVVGKLGTYDSTECALRDADGELSPLSRIRGVDVIHDVDRRR
jgi:hypothetical protein